MKSGRTHLQDATPIRLGQEFTAYGHTVARHREKLAQAARIFAAEPITIQLRYLQTLTEIGTEKNSTILFPLPIEMLRALMGSEKLA